jgi:uncharacterized membrane protein YgdD (TMEM256/DUF423 family)
MSQRNPYEPPQARVADIKPVNCSRDGNIVIVPIGSDLPPRCIKCNAPAEEPIKKVKLYWHNPGIYLLIFFNILVYAIVALIVRRTVKVSPGLCAVHLTKHRREILILHGLGGCVCAIGIGLLRLEKYSMATVSFLLVGILLIVGTLVLRKVYAKEITKEYVRLGGCKEPFLASLE